MHRFTTKAAGLVLVVAIITPLFASAQTASSTDFTAQIQALIAQIQSLQQQVRTLIAQQTASSTFTNTLPPPQFGTGDSSWSNGNNASSSSPGRMNMCPTIARNLVVGAHGDDVQQLQSMLADQGFLAASSTTGFFGRMTARALVQFQQQNNIAGSSTGRVGPLTRAFLQNHCKPMGQGNGSNGNSMPGMMGSSTQLWRGGEQWSQQGDHQGQGMMGSTTPPCGVSVPPSNSAPVGSAHTNYMIMRPCGGQGDQGQGSRGEGNRPQPLGRDGNHATSTAPALPPVPVTNSGNTQ